MPIEEVIDGASSVAEPIRPSAAVDAVMVADISDLRNVCTARISEPFCFEKTADNYSRKLACTERARIAGLRRYIHSNVIS